MPLLLGIDIGTTGTRALLIDEAGRVVGSAVAEYPLYTPHPQWAEQDPVDWWKATCEATRTVLARARVHGGEVGGVGLSGQMHGVVLLDENTACVELSRQSSHLVAGVENSLLNRGYLRGQITVVTLVPKT